MPDGQFSVEAWGKILQTAYQNECLIKEVDDRLVYEDFFMFVHEANNNSDSPELKEFVKATEIFAASQYVASIIKANTPEKKKDTRKSKNGSGAV